MYDDLLFDIQKNFENHSSVAELLPAPEDQIFEKPTQKIYSLHQYRK